MKQKTTMERQAIENHIVKLGLLGKTKKEKRIDSLKLDLMRVQQAIEKIEMLENKQWLQFAEPIGQLLQLQRLLTDVLATLEDTEE